MAGTQVTTRRLTDVAKGLEEIVSRYNQSVASIYQIGGDIDAMWDGDANQKFMATLGSDQERFGALAKLLMEYSSKLNETATIYAKAENDAIGILNTRK